MTDSSSDSVALVLTTFPDLDQARQIGTKLVERQLIACITLLPPALSIYQWKETLEQNEEVPALLKTTRAAISPLQNDLLSLHPYEVPEFLVIPVEGGLPSYLSWVRAQVNVSASPGKEC
ncbi:MAG: divalent-cation tolerance protein CutA [Verrucomicrobiota bacterium]